MSFAKTGYVTVFNDYIITTNISKELTKKIDHCYQQSSNLEELEAQLREIGIEKKKIHLTIERNKSKATKIRKSMLPVFYVPKELKETFDLF